MRDNPLLFLLLLAVVVMLFLHLIKRRETPDQRSARLENEARARQEAEAADADKLHRLEAERQRQLAAAEERRVAEAAAWRVEVAEDAERRKAEREKDRIAHQEERAERLQQERREQKEAMEAASRRQAAEAAARSKAEAERAEQLGEDNRSRRLLQEERAKIRSAAIPSDIQRDMAEFLRGREFFGEDHSPLAYVGYRVGITNGLPPLERRRRLRACFQIEIPNQLAAKYQAWGPPVTFHRLSSMCQHITMLAAMRRDRPGYEVAVSEWETDVAWFNAEYRNLAERLRRAGIE